MAKKEVVTKKENQRRLVVLIACIAFDTLALTGIVFSWKGINDITSPAKAGNLEEHRAKIADVRRERVAMEQAYASFSAPVGWSFVSTSTTDRTGSSGLAGQPLREFLDGWAKELATNHGVAEFKNADSGEGITLVQLFDKLKSLEDQYRSDCTRLEGEIKTQRDREAASGKDIDTAELAALNTIKSADGNTGLIMDYQKAIRELNDLERQHALELTGDGSQENGGLEAEAYTAQQKLTDLKKQHIREKQELELRRGELALRKGWIIHKREEAKERKDPDGEILGVVEGQNIAFVDLVHSDRIFRGSRFKVYSLEKGGVKADKGEIEVLEVRNEISSKVSIIRTIHADDPIRPGDKIYNEVFERGKTRKIAIAGLMTGRLSNDEVAKVIQSFGDEYQETADEATNYVILGERWQESANFKVAQDLGIRLMREQTLYDYLGVPQD